MHKKIFNAPLKSDPFPYFYIENIFPESLYNEILDSFPDPSHYTKCPANQQRWCLELEPETVDRLPLAYHLFWKRICQILLETVPVICQKFHLEGDFLGVPQLTLDREQYSIEPHTDIPEKAATLLFYLPKTASQSHLGTALYRPKDPSFICEGRERHPFHLFEKVWQAPFIPNSLFAFLKTNNSFHGVEPIGKEPIERHILSFTLWRHDTKDSRLSRM